MYLTNFFKMNSKHIITAKQVLKYSTSSKKQGYLGQSKISKTCSKRISKLFRISKIFQGQTIKMFWKFRKNLCSFFLLQFSF